MTTPLLPRTHPGASTDAYSYPDNTTRPAYSDHRESERWRKSSDYESAPNDSKLRGHKAQQVEERTRLELGKLVTVVLKRLQSREMPPSSLGPLYSHREGSSMYATANAVRGAVRMAGGGSEWRRGASSATEELDEEDEEDDESQFSTEETFTNLMTVRDSLLMHGETLFLTGVTGANVRSMPRVTRSSSPGRKDKVPSMGREDRNEVDDTNPMTLLNDLISLLGEIVMEDCRYKISRIRLKCPPYALQGVVLEVSSILARLHRRKPEILSKLGFAILPAFSTFPPSLHERVLRFYEEDILKAMLPEYSRTRRPQAHTVNFNVPFTTGSAVPEIQVEQAHEDSSKGRSLPFEPWSKGDIKSGATAWTAPRQSIAI
ncbi:hypothetical protein FRC17_005741 [Serendipita sp. 399]|nr:hypothetical protein FRC17_005741 [Serendipita sp. 399]